MKFKFALIAVATVSASSAYAGGMEVTRLPTSMMFEDGNHASLSFGKFSPDVTDNVYATNGSMYKDRSAITATFKTQINDKISIGFASYKSAEIQLDYSNASVLFSSQSLPDPYVDLAIETMALLGRYEVFNNISIVGGLKYSKGSGGGNVLNAPAGVIAAAEDTTLGGIIGISYENPEIAMRISGVYQAKQDMEHATTTTVTGPTVISLEDTKSALPASFTIDFQTGIAADTLLFGSIHHALWDDAHISFWSLAGALGGTDGDEVLYRGDLTEEELLNFIRKAKKEIKGVPIGYVDAYYEFADRPAITDICDVIYANCYPFWEGCSQEYSLLYMKDMYHRAKRAGNGKRVIISETGWPNKGSSLEGAFPSEENALKYFINAQKWSKEEHIEMFYFSSFDEAWKVGSEGDVGAYWGIWDKNEKLKY